MGEGGGGDSFGTCKCKIKVNVFNVMSDTDYLTTPATKDLCIWSKLHLEPNMVVYNTMLANILMQFVDIVSCCVLSTCMWIQIKTM